MAEINEIIEQLQRDAEYWKLKFDQAVNNGKVLTAERNDMQAQINAVHGRCEQLEKELDQARQSEVGLIAENDALEDRITKLRGAIKAFEEDNQRNNWNRDLLKKIGNLARSAL